MKKKKRKKENILFPYQALIMEKNFFNKCR
jgi:hypothetical protein